MQVIKIRYAATLVDPLGGFLANPSERCFVVGAVLRPVCNACYL